MNRISRFLLVVLAMTLIPAAGWGQNEDLEAFKHAYRQYEFYFKRGDLKKSLPEARLAYELGQKLLPEDSKDMALLTFNYGDNLLRSRRHDAAEPILAEALRRTEQVFGADSIKLVPVLMDLGHISAFRRDDQNKRKRYKRAFGLVEQHHGVESVEYGWRSVNAGKDMLYIGQDKAGARYLKDGHEILQSSLGEDHVKTRFAAYNLGKFELSEDNYKAAEKHLLQALSDDGKSEKQPSSFELSAHAFLVNTYERQGKSELATPHCLAIGRMTPFDSTRNYFPVFKQAPLYPKSALRQEKEGHVIVKYMVDERGFVRDPEVIEVQGSEVFVGPSLDAVKKFRYAPRFIDGKAARVPGVSNKFYFEIAD